MHQRNRTICSAFQKLFKEEKMELYELTVHELMEKLEKNEITSEDIIKSYSKKQEKSIDFW